MLSIATVVAALSVAASNALPAEPEPPSLRVPAFGEVTSVFGPRWGRMHHGIDYGTLEQLAVVAAADGKVVRTGYLPGYEGYGLVVLIDHGEGYRTMYAHLSRIRVELGQDVAAGSWIAVAGATGSSAGVHLHFELRERGVPIDPAPFMTG